MAVQALLKKVFFLEKLAKNKLDSVVMALVDLAERLSGIVTVVFLQNELLRSLQMGADNCPDPLKQSLSNHKLESKLGLALVLQLTDARQCLADLLLAGSVFCCRVFESVR